MNARTLTHDEFLEEAKARFPGDPLDIAFTCPSCGDVAAIREFAPPERERAGQECIGRSVGALDACGTGTRGKWDGRGCTFAAYGLIQGPWTVVMPDGHEVHSFALAEGGRP
jgi:hypothetical protein